MIDSPADTDAPRHAGGARHTGGGPDDAARTAYLSERFVAPDADRLRTSPGEVVTYLRLLTFSGSHRHITGGQLLAPHEIVDVVLSGVEKPEVAKTGTGKSCPTEEPATAGAVKTATRTRKAR